jgi:hypothetical protein
MFSGTKNKWLVLVAIAALAAFVIACGTDETKLVSNDGGNGGVGAQPTVIVPDPTGPAGDPPPIPIGDQSYETVEVLAPIESVQIMGLESFPEQYVVQVISGLPSGCAAFSHSEASQDGSEIKIDIYNTVPSPEQSAVISCLAIYGLHDENVALGSDFDRDTRYNVTVNGQAVGYFKAGVSGTIPTDLLPVDGSDPGFVVEPAPVEGLEIIIGEDSRGPVTYYAHVLWGLSNGCKESLEPNLIQSSRSAFTVYPMVKTPTGDVACTDDYRMDSAQVELGVVGEGLTFCAFYTVSTGKETVDFQAIAPNVRCADPNSATPMPAPFPPSGGGSIIADSKALELSLEAKGADVEYGGQSGDSKQFSLIPTEMKVNGQQVLVYEFGPGSAVTEASKTVSSDGSSFESDGMVMTVQWIANPHFYLYGNAIILYVGDDEGIGGLLDSVATQFAGIKFETTGNDDVDDSEFTERLAFIEKFGMISTRSIPAQHSVGVTIMLSNGCEEFKSIDWSLVGREVRIEVLTQVPTTPTPCTLAIAYEEQSINIGDKFAAGVEYDVIVNGERQGSFVGNNGQVAANEGTAEFVSRLATIEKVTMASTKSIPAQHLVGVTIALGGSCEAFKSIDWSVEGREVHIKVLTEVPLVPVPCTLAIIYEEQSINIGGKYEAGVEYDVIVNGERQGTFVGG